MVKYDLKYYDFLNKLRLYGEINMFGAIPHLLNEFKELNVDAARDILIDWMRTFKG